MSKQKVAFVTPGSFPIPSAGSSSVERVVEKMVPWLAADVEPVIYGRSAKGLARIGQVGGVRCVRYPAQDKGAYVRAVSASARRLGPDLIEVENRPGYVLTLGRRHPATRIWLNLHSTSFIGADAIARERLRASFRRAERIIVNSEFLRDEVVRRVPEAAAKVRVVHIGVDAGASCRAGSRRERRGASGCGRHGAGKGGTSCCSWEGSSRSKASITCCGCCPA